MHSLVESHCQYTDNENGITSCATQSACFKICTFVADQWIKTNLTFVVFGPSIHLYFMWSQCKLGPLLWWSLFCEQQEYVLTYIQSKTAVNLLIRDRKSVV